PTGLTGGGNDTSAPYIGTYAWDSTLTGTQKINATVTNGAALTAVGQFTLSPDSAAPTGGSTSYASGFYTTASVAITLLGGTDGAGSGIGTLQVQRDSATLSPSGCGSFPGSWSNVTLVGGNDTSVLSGTCEMYRYVV